MAERIFGVEDFWLGTGFSVAETIFDMENFWWRTGIFLAERIFGSLLAKGNVDAVKDLWLKNGVLVSNGAFCIQDVHICVAKFW